MKFNKPKTGTSSVASSITTPTTPKASAFAVNTNVPPPRPAWATIAKSNAPPPDLRQTMLKARASQIGGSVVSRMQGLNLDNPLIHPGAFNPNVLNPSLGPLPPAGNLWGGSAVESNMTTNTYFQAVKTDECVRTERTVRHFRKGEVIALPFHVANMNAKLDIGHERLTRTIEGPAFSKRRMFVILWTNQLDMFCLPLYSFEGRGLSGKKEDHKADYVCMVNKGREASFNNQGKYEPVVFESYNRRPMADETTVHLTGGVTVDPRGDISFVGRLDLRSHVHLMGLWQDRVAIAKDKPWDQKIVMRR
ncbi:unnamed protein product [Zymoseptoria tritici ST99CH_3D1]|nr:unnamed protein product [Zymoseptoria tritici ST99CH_3D1]